MNCCALQSILTTPLLFPVQIPDQRETFDLDLRLNGTLWSRHRFRLQSPQELGSAFCTPNKRKPPPRRRLTGPTSCLGLLCRRDRLVALRVLPAEPLYASRRIDKSLLARKERVANRANFHVNVALVGRPGFKNASASAHHPHRGIIGMNLFLGHRQTDLSYDSSLFIVSGFARFRNSGAGNCKSSFRLLDQLPPPTPLS